MINEREDDRLFLKGVGELIKRRFAVQRRDFEGLIEQTRRDFDKRLMTLQVTVDVTPEAIGELRAEMRETLAGIEKRLRDIDDAVQEQVERVAHVVVERVSGELREVNLGYNERALKLFNTIETRAADLAQPEDGAPGADGAPGMDGAPGAEGPAGPVGLQGPQGEPGLDGKDGAPGKDGAAGKDGEPGQVGEPGPVGPMGPQGEPGRDGAAGVPGKDGEPGAEGPPGEPGRDGADGVSPDPDAIAASVTDKVLASIGPAFDEKLIEFQTDADHVLTAANERMTSLRDGLDGKDGAPGEPGKDADPEAIVALVLEHVEPRVEELLVGVRATGPTPDDLKALVAEQVEARVPRDFAQLSERAQKMLHNLDLKFSGLAAGKDGRDGKDGATGPAGAPGAAGEPGVAGEPGPQGERGEDGANGRDGVDGAEWIHTGTFDKDHTYDRSDVVAVDGGSFVAVRDEPGPCPGPGWRLLSGRGRAGQRGEQGPRGPQGKQGEPGVGISDVVEEKGHVYFLLTDGRTVVIPWSRSS